jgi:hypothetical protein
MLSEEAAEELIVLSSMFGDDFLQISESEFAVFTRYGFRFFLFLSSRSRTHRSPSTSTTRFLLSLSVVNAATTTHRKLQC